MTKLIALMGLFFTLTASATSLHPDTFRGSVSPISEVIHLDEEGQYIVTFSRMGSCHDAEIQFKKEIRFQEGALVFKHDGLVKDDTIRPMICRAFAQNRGQVVINVGRPTKVYAEQFIPFNARIAPLNIRVEKVLDKEIL